MREAGEDHCRAICGDSVLSYQSGPGIIAATAGETSAAHVGDERGESQADGAGQQDGGVGPPHHPMKHKRLSRDTQVVTAVMLMLHFTQITRPSRVDGYTLTSLKSFLYNL